MLILNPKDRGVKSLILSFLLAVCFSSFAQNTDTTYWKSSGISSLTASQISLTNWVAGGQNSTAINGNINFFANRTKNRSKWKNSVEVAYGLIRQGNEDIVKSDDKFNIVTNYGYKLQRSNDHWFFSGIMDFRSQFDKGFNPESDSVLISDFMAPGYLILSLGATYERNEKLSFSYHPLTGKFTFVTIQSLADNGDYGVDPAVRDERGNIIAPG